MKCLSRGKNKVFQVARMSEKLLRSMFLFVTEFYREKDYAQKGKTND